jgi:AcrR family transcriptional regulator
MKVCSSTLTRRKIVDVATDVFGQMGYQTATIREIVKLAGVNQAAVNYHFRGKDALYIETIKQAFERMNLHVSTKDQTETPENQLRSFLLQLLSSLRCTNAESCKFTRLVARELTEPSGIFTYPAQHHEFAAGIVKRFFPEDISEHRITLATFWLLAQCAVMERATRLFGHTDKGAICQEKETMEFFLSLIFKGLAQDKCDAC